MLDDTGAMEGWLNRHTPQGGLFASREPAHNWRLVRAVLHDGTLTLSALQGYPVKAFDPAAPPSGPPRHLATSTPPLAAAASPQLAAHPGVPNGANGGPPGGPAAAAAAGLDPLPAALADLRLGAGEPHPELRFDENGAVVGGSPAALAHYLLFAPGTSPAAAGEALLAAVPFATDLLLVLRAMRAYVDSAAGADVAAAVTGIVHTLLHLYEGLVLNTNVHAALQQLADSLVRIDNAAATQLKLDIYKRFETASSAVAFPVPLPPAPGAPDAGLAIRIQQAVRPYASQLWLPPDLFLNRDFFAELAPQISLFHQHFWARWAPTTDISLLFHRQGDAAISEWRVNPLVFDLQTPHFLGALLLNHALAPQLEHAQRGALLSQWIILGSQLRDLGDIVGWVAIASIMCQVTVLRLRESWAYVDPELRARVSREWGFEVFELEKRATIDILDKTTFRASTEEMGEKYPKARCVPYFGDIIVMSPRAVNDSSPEGTDLSHVQDRIDRMRAVVDGWHYYFEQAPDVPYVAPQPEPNPYVQNLLNTWLKLNATLPNPLQTAAQASLAIEPRALGNYLPFHYTQLLPLSNGAFVPILFTEVNPSFRLLPKSTLIATSGVVSPSASKRSLRGFNFSAAAANGAPINISGPSPAAARDGLRRSNSFPPLNQPLTTGVREVELGTREYMTKHNSGHALVRTIRDLFNVGVTTHSVGTDLVLKSIDDEGQRSSRHSSIIENLGRRSIMLDSRRQSVQSLELAQRISSLEAHNALNVVVKATSLPRLVDTLVLGVGEFSAAGTSARFKINLPVHTETFLATFRSFCSPAELLRMLEHRFDGAAGAAVSIVQQRGRPSSERPDNKFPRWKALLELPSGQAFRVATQIYLNILEALQFWVSEYYFDFADDEALRGTTHRFLKHIESVLSQSTYPENVQTQARRLVGSFVKQRYKVAEAARAVPMPTLARRLAPLPPVVGEDTLPALEKHIEDLDTIVGEYFSMIAIKDWMQLFETLEVQAGGCNALFNYQASNTSNEDDLPIQDIFSYFSTLYRTTPSEKILATLPSCIVSLFRLHTNIAEYIAYQVSDPAAAGSNRPRVSRMTYVLKLLGILKTRMRYFDLFPEVEDKRTRVPSFLESAIVAGILRPESRSCAQAWLQAGRETAMEFGYDPESTMESISSLGLLAHDGEFDPHALPNSQTLFIPTIPSNLLRSAGPGGIRPITPCIGWVTERLFEIVCYVPNMSVENPELINFDKRRYAYNLVKNIQSEFAFKVPPRTELESLVGEYDYLLNPEPTLYKFDKRAIKDAISREMHGISKSQLKQRVFTAAVAAELEKLKLETKQREIIASRQQGVGGIPLSSSTSSLNLRDKRSLRSNRPVSTLMGTPPSSSGASTTSSSTAERDRRARRFGAGILKAVRPLSMAFTSSVITPVAGSSGSGGQGSLSSGTNSGSGSNSVPGIVNPTELPDAASLHDHPGKTVASIDLADFEIKGPRAHGVFRLVRHGTEHVLQAPSEGDAGAWLSALESARRLAIARTQVRPGSTRVFGVPIAVVCEREGLPIPRMMSLLFEQIEDRGLDEVGLYRISGSLAAINTLKGAFDAGEVLKPADPRWLDVNAVAGCVKLYLRELPEPLLTDALFAEFVACAAARPDEGQLERLREAIGRLPPPNYNLLRRLMQHLSLVVQHEATNKMSTPNLAIVFSMNFLPPNGMDQMRAMQSIVNSMIVHHAFLFAGPGPAAATADPRPTASPAPGSVHTPSLRNGAANGSPVKHTAV